MRTNTCVIAVVAAIACWTPAAAQSVKHIQTKEAGIASAVWVGDMLYVSGQLPSPVTPADRAKGTPAVYGNTQAQADSVFLKIQALLKEQGLGMGDIVMMRVYMAADATDNKLDFAGMNAAYAKFFGTADQPNKPARSTFQVAALVVAGALLEIEVQAARSSPSAFTSEQAAAGQTAYANSCAMCHMPDLRGSADAPPLADANFMSSWGTRTTKDLLAYMSAAMPAGGPSLDAGTYESIAAYILKSNGAEAGAQALGTSTVATIRDLVRSAR